MLRAASKAALSQPTILLRPPCPSDARAIWQLAADTPTLDLNSPYAYLLVCSHFAATSVVGLHDDRLVGFVAAYRPPSKSEVIFVWQIAVDATLGRTGLGTRMLDRVLDAAACRGVRCLEATITPPNDASRRLFAGFARRRGVDFHEEIAFTSDLFPGNAHEPEILVRVGPFHTPLRGTV